ncbi:MAG: AraC family transcriptional regulator [Alcanivorax sp.]|nr:AraC family transcriptional regulator [Alcanivorax sp.]
MNNPNNTRPGTLTVASYWIEYLLDAALHLGCDLSADLLRLGITEEQLEQPQARVPLRAEQALLQAAVSRTGDACFGLHMGEMIRPRFMGELGYATMSSANLRQALELTIPFQRVTNELISLDVEREGGQLVLLWDALLPDLPETHHRIEALCAGSVTFGRWITGKTEENPVAVHFRHSAPADTSEHARIFRCPVHFDSHSNSVILDQRMLDMPIRDADAEVHRIMRNRVHQAMTQFLARDNLLDQVRAEIQQQLLHGTPQLESVAEAMNVKPWTLRRRLRAEEADFTTLLDDERKALATDWLINSDRPVSQIAADLGYSEQSAFNRAFRRWFACTPVAYRQQYRG